MSIPHKNRLTLVAIAAALVMAFIFVVPYVFDLNRYRPKIISYLQDKSGKAVEIGRLTLNFFPTLSIHVYDFGMKNPAEFPPGYFIKVARIDAEVDAAPLLHRRIVIKSVVLRNPFINLFRTLTDRGTLRTLSRRTWGSYFWD